MSEIPLRYSVPASLSEEALFAKLGRLPGVVQKSNLTVIRRFCDTFDWRLYAAGWQLENEETACGISLHLRPLNGPEPDLFLKLDTPPRFAWDLPPGALRCRLQPVLEMRALLPVLEMRCLVTPFEQLDKEGKIILRLHMECCSVVDRQSGETRPLETCLRLVPIKGYGQALKKADAALRAAGLTLVEEGLLDSGLALVGRRPLDYASKFRLVLDPETRADVAAKAIFKTLFQGMRANEAGMMENLDSEFLHDFRVALRRTRTALGQTRKVLPPEAVRFVEEFSWLQGITSEARDLDVYLLNFDTYKKSLPVTIREDLDALHGFLEKRQKKAHRELVRQLASERYRRLMSDWAEFLEAPSESGMAVADVKSFADGRIRKVHRGILKAGRAITPASPASELHALRKRCKKLRYLLEFFQSLYSPKRMKDLIKALKGLQDNLGAHQDYEVQEMTLKTFSQEMMGDGNTPARSLLAMGVLVQDLDKRRIKAREEFAVRFETFDSEKTRAEFARLFGKGT